MDKEKAIAKLSGKLDDESIEASKFLSHLGSIKEVEALSLLLNHKETENRFLAAKTLEDMEANQIALPRLWEAIENPENSEIKGDLMSTLQGYDISLYYVNIFKLYLFGAFKVTRTAENLLDFQDFDITARVIKKAKKQWAHYSNNVKQDDAYTLKKLEVEERLKDLQEFVDSQESQS
ncbi:hypothetical protein [Roseivirga sp.]|uniref:hypothetical protein n=1 Tax=Roseivirga sp. TaxID=1964215 RepID=UPI003B8C431A